MALLNVFFKLFGFRWLFYKFRPLISWIFFRLFIGAFFAVGYSLLFFMYSKTHGFLMPYLLLAVFGLYISLFFSGIFNLGNWFFKVFSLALPISFVLGFGIKLNNLNNEKSSQIAVTIGLFISLSLFLILSFKKHIFPYIKNKLNPEFIPLNKTLQEIDAMGSGDSYEKGRQFEEYVASLYNALGYYAETTTEMRKKGTLPGAIQSRGGSGEQGVDVVLYDPRNGETYIVQCKHYSGKVSNSAIQEIVTAKALYNATKAFVVTNQEFTGPAIELAIVNEVELVDRHLLPTLILNAVECERNKKAA